MLDSTEGMYWPRQKQPICSMSIVEFTLSITMSGESRPAKPSPRTRRSFRARDESLPWDVCRRRTSRAIKRGWMVWLAKFGSPFVTKSFQNFGGLVLSSRAIQRIAPCSPHTRIISKKLNIYDSSFSILEYTIFSQSIEIRAIRRIRRF